MNRTPLKPLAALILAALTARAGLAQTPTNWDGAANGGTNDLNLTISSLQGLPAPEVKAAAVPIRRDVGAWKAALSLKAKIAAARAQALRSLPAGAARKRELSASVKLSDGSQALLAQSDAKPAPPSSSAPKAQASALTKTY
ncbi:MAG: hypothetical protein HYZ74_07780, partial [Elusimicrobia bacterium]|nr:hypothetical protein [Elusimicrobiota bacterium]